MADFGELHSHRGQPKRLNGQAPSLTESESRGATTARIKYWPRFRHQHVEAEMGLPGANDIELRFAAYVEGLVSVIGHADRAGPLRDYCMGLVMPCERKSVEPMAAVTAPARTAAQHQSLLHFVGRGRWSDDEGVGARCERWCLPRIERYGPIEAWIIDDTAFPSRGGIRLAWRTNIAASSASRRTARSRCRCRLPTTMRACRWPIGCICRRTGRGPPTSPQSGGS